MKVTMRELKAGLSRYVVRARAGEVIEITSHDTPVARIVGIPSATSAVPAGIARLLASGAAQWSGGKPNFGSPLTLSDGGKFVSEMVVEDRS